MRSFPTCKPALLLYLSVLSVIPLVTTFFIAANFLFVKPLSFAAPDAFPINAQITCTTELISADATARTLEMDWYPEFTSSCTDPGFVADIYINSDSLDSSSPSFTTLPPASPAYRLNTTFACGENSTIVAGSFRTIIKLLGSNYNIRPGIVPHSSLQEYPFDVYDARFSIYALDHETGAAISLNVTQSYGVAVNFEVSLLRSFVDNNQLRLDLKVGRAKATKAFVILVAVSNWLVASAFLIISAATIVYPNPRLYQEIFVLPIGVLFAFTSIRANFPGAPPGFGARIDLYSILPVLVVITFCGFLLLLIVLYQRISEDREALNPASDRASTFPESTIAEEDNFSEDFSIRGHARLSHKTQSLQSVDARTDEVAGDSMTWGLGYP